MNWYLINYKGTCLKFSNYYPSNLYIVNFTIVNFANNAETDFQYYAKDYKISI